MSEKNDTSGAIVKMKKANPTTSTSTQRLTLKLSFESKRKAHAMAEASNCSIEQVIESLIINHTETPKRPQPDSK